MQKRTILSFFFFTFLGISYLFPQELEISGGMGNILFDQGRSSSLGQDGESFMPVLSPFGLIRIMGEHGNNSYDIGFEIDPILRNRLYANYIWDFEYLVIEAGPFLNIVRSRVLPVNPGISAGLTLQYPGIIFAQGSVSSTFAYFFREKTGFHNIYSANLSLGFWIPHVICSFNMDIQNFTIRETENLIIEDMLERWYFRANIFAKNVPYTIIMDIGYQNLKRAYTGSTVIGGNVNRATETDQLHSIFTNIEGMITINHRIKLILGGFLPIFSWSELPMLNPPRDTTLFQANAGVILSF